MTIITPTGITGITSITSTGNTLQFQNPSGADVSVSGLNVTSGTNINVTGIVTASGGFSGNINSTGVSTFTNGPVFIGAATSTGTTSQRLQVTGGAYISGNLGVGITTPKGAIHLVDSSYKSLIISNTTTNATGTGGVIAGDRYTKTNNPFVGFATWDYNTGRKAYVGGGGWNLPEATEIGLYTATTYDETSNAALERLKIDSAGRVTMPYQPAFQAYSTTNASVASGTTVLPFNATNFNIGSHYNTSTYRFTAPIAGRYLFSVNLNLYNAPGIMMPGVRINGSSFYHGNRLTGNINGDNNLNAIVILSLSVNDYVEAMSTALGSSSTLSNGATWTRFEGYLIG